MDVTESADTTIAVETRTHDPQTFVGAIGSTRLEGREPSAFTLRQAERVCTGEITPWEAREEAIRRHTR